MFNPEKKLCSIVLIGAFNPVMFEPEWFSRNKIISPEEVDFAKSQPKNYPLIITPQLTAFKTSQFSIKIEQKRFEVVCDKDPLISIKDFIVKSFEKLGGFVINAYGINFNAHYAINSKKTYQKIGDNLAPKKYWATLLDDEIDGDERSSGLAAIQMQKLKKENEGSISVILRPSGLFKPGVYIACNDHTNISIENSNAEDAIEEIDNIFEDSIKFMQKIQEELLSEAVK